MIMGIAAVVLALAGGGYVMLQNQGSDAGSVATPQGDTKVPLNQRLTTPPVNIPRELEEISPMTDDTTSARAALAREALSRLQGLDSMARASDESTFVHFRYLRGKALMTSGDESAGCDSLANIEGRLNASRFKRAATVLLNFCRQQ